LVWLANPAGTALLLGGIAAGLAQSDWNTDEENPATDDGPEAEIMVGLGLIAIFAAPFVDVIIAREPERTTQAQSWTLQPWLSARSPGGGVVFTGRL
jgi:hypothetical protein